MWRIKNRHTTKTKHNPVKANNTKYSRAKLAWFSRLTLGQERGGLILQRSWALESVYFCLPSMLWHCRLRHQICKNIVPEMTCTVSSGTLNLSHLNRSHMWPADKHIEASCYVYTVEWSYTADVIHFTLTSLMPGISISGISSIVQQ